MTDIVERIEEAFKWDTFWDTDAPPLLKDAVAEIASLRLTDAEREAIEAAIAYLQPVGNYDSRVQDTLRKMLERLK